jgi:DNA-cytosine methyltransferase
MIAVPPGGSIESPVAKYVPYTLAEVRSTAPRFTGATFFAGGGGSTCGLRMAGGDIRSAVEFSPWAADAYRRNNPTTRLEQRDVRQITASGSTVEEFLKAAGLSICELDYLDSSPPCQPHSTGGRGMRDPSRLTLHSGVQQTYAATLPFEVARFAHVALPKVCVMENVPGMVMRTPEFLERILNAFRFDQGRRLYYASWKILGAHEHGVAQKRRRLFAISVRKDVAEAVGIHSDQMVEEAFPQPTTGTLSIRAALHGLEQSIEDELPFLQSIRLSKLPRLLLRLPKCPDKPQRLKNARSYYTLVRCSWDCPAPTLVIAGQKPDGLSGAIHPEVDRKFTIPELKRLFGLPEDFALVGTIEQAVDTICNMVPPPLTKAVAERLYERVLKPLRAQEMGRGGAALTR